LLSSAVADLKSAPVTFSIISCFYDSPRITRINTDYLPQ
jgi:hypothetical protein